MTEKRRQDLSLREYEELAEAVRGYQCLYDKAKKENKDKMWYSKAWVTSWELRITSYELKA